MGLPDFSALRFTKYNQYESMILPLVKYLESHGVSVEYGMDVKNVVIKDENSKKIATQIVYEKDGKPGTIDLIEDDLVFITKWLLYRYFLLWRSEYSAGFEPD